MPSGPVPHHSLRLGRAPLRLLPVLLLPLLLLLAAAAARRPGAARPVTPAFLGPSRCVRRLPPTKGRRAAASMPMLAPGAWGWPRAGWCGGGGVWNVVCGMVSDAVAGGAQEQGEGGDEKVRTSSPFFFVSRGMGSKGNGRGMAGWVAWPAHAS